MTASTARWTDAQKQKPDLWRQISSWTNSYATGLVSDAQYSPPIRNYGYDTRFNDVTQLPPFTPVSTTVVDVVRF